MLTPRFTLTQDDKFLTVTIYAPFTHIDQTEIFMDGEDFRFSSPPYFLRLHLPGEVTESEEASGSWDADTTSFVVKCPKLIVGEHFEGLDSLTKLLTPRGITQVKNPIEVLEESEVNETEDEEEIDWFVEQTYPAEEETLLKDRNSYGYGFGCKHVDVFSKLSEELSSLLDLPMADSLTHQQREQARREKELEDFCSSHYLCDLFEGEGLVECLAYKPPWDSIPPGDPHHPALAFSPEEQERLLALPRVQQLVSKTDLASVHLGLADILFGLCYSLRSNQGTDCVEFGWCVAKLTASLTCLTRPRTPAQLVTGCVRRALTYPLYRHWELALATWRDVIKLLGVGRAAVVKQLLAIIPQFTETPGHYIFNQLFIQDYCTWAQSVPHSHLTSLSEALSTALASLTKEDLEFDLEEFEAAGRLTLEEEKMGQDVESLVKDIGKVKVSLDSDDSSSDDSDDSESDSDITSDDDEGS